MPNIDLSMEELKRYKGIREIPNDMELFWKNRMEKLDESEERVEILSSSFQSPICDCFNLSFRGVDGEKISAKMIMPKKIEGKIPGVIEFHGYGGSSGDWTRRLHYSALGIAYFIMDCRDQMGESGKDSLRVGNLTRGLHDGAEELYYTKVYLDALRLVNIVSNMPKIDKDNILTLGYSQGGALSLVSAALSGKIKGTFAVYPYLCDFKRVWDLDYGDFAYDELREFFRWYDPTHENEERYFGYLDYIDVKNFAFLMKSDVTLATGLVDKVCPPSTQFSLFNRLKVKKDHIIYPDFGHENIRGLEDKIYTWVLNILNK